MVSEINSRDSTVLNAYGLHSLQLDRKAVSVPAGNVWSTETAHILILYDEVLEGLIEGVTQMDLSVGIGRSVVKNIRGLALILLYHLVIEAFIFPFFEIGLSLRQISSHGEFCLR